MAEAGTGESRVPSPEHQCATGGACGLKLDRHLAEASGVSSHEPCRATGGDQGATGEGCGLKLDRHFAEASGVSSQEPRQQTTDADQCVTGGLCGLKLDRHFAKASGDSSQEPDVCALECALEMMGAVDAVPAAAGTCGRTVPASSWYLREQVQEAGTDESRVPECHREVLLQRSLTANQCANVFVCSQELERLVVATDQDSTHVPDQAQAPVREYPSPVALPLKVGRKGRVMWDSAFVRPVVATDRDSTPVPDQTQEPVHECLGPTAFPLRVGKKGRVMWDSALESVVTSADALARPEVLRPGNGDSSHVPCRQLSAVARDESSQPSQCVSDDNGVQALAQSSHNDASFRAVGDGQGRVLWQPVVAIPAEVAQAPTEQSDVSISVSGSRPLPHILALDVLVDAPRNVSVCFLCSRQGIHHCTLCYNSACHEHSIECVLCADVLCSRCDLYNCHSCPNYKGSFLSWLCARGEACSAMAANEDRRNRDSYIIFGQKSKYLM